MKTPRFSPAVLLAVVGFSGAIVRFAGFRRSEPVGEAPAAPPVPRLLALAPHRGSEPIDAPIVAAQERAVAASAPRSLENPGGLFVQKARLSNEPGCSELAERCALATEAVPPDQPDALLLRGHTAEAMHRFRDAEAVTRRRVAQRDFVLDHALPGAALIEQGRVVEAVDDTSQTLTPHSMGQKVAAKRSRRLAEGLVPPNNQGLVTKDYNQGESGENPACEGISAPLALDRSTRSTIDTTPQGSRIFAGGFGISVATAHRRWTQARAWRHQEIKTPSPPTRAEARRAFQFGRAASPRVP